MKTVGIISLLLVGLYVLSDWLYVNVLPQRYIFDHNEVMDMVNASLERNPGGNATEIMIDLGGALKERYGKYINELDFDNWVFNNAGGAMGSMFVLHASITEYLIFFGSSVGTEGHTGVHYADDYYMMLTGKEVCTVPGKMEPEVYLPGSAHHLVRGQVKQYGMPAGSWALELAQGWIPAMLPFGFLDTFTSTLDLGTLWNTVKISAFNMGRNMVWGKI
ncbi:C-8 sterol isomerase [Yarrowia sp. B02]|nr:C-8 sterol isomerase [Yarrowia sp. B02]